MFGIATNMLRHHYRAESRHLAACARHFRQAGPLASSDEGVDQRLDAAAAVRRLVPDLLRLSSQDRDILLLNAWAGLEPTEIAAALGMPAGTVRSRLHRLRGHLRAAALTEPGTTASAIPLHSALADTAISSGDHHDR